MVAVPPFEKVRCAGIFHLLTLLLLFLSASANACEVIDDSGHKIVLSHPAQRIISLAPDLTENLFAIGAGQQIVGVMLGSDYPPAAKRISVVASYNSVDLEKIIAKKPDLIVVWGEGRINESLRSLSIPVYVSQPRKISDIPNTLIRLGYLTGHEKGSKQIAEAFSDKLHVLKKKYGNKKQVRVFYEVWQQPLITISNESWIGDAIRICGGKNLFGKLNIASPTVNLESVLSKNPDLIISSNSRTDWKNYWNHWKDLNAVKDNHLFTINPDEIERASPRLLKGVISICEDIDKSR